MKGVHLTGDLYRCECDLTLLSNPTRLEALCNVAIEEARLTRVQSVFHKFDDAGDAESGVTGTVLLAESHLALHTWPEFRSVALDVYVCNFTSDNTKKAQMLFEHLRQIFQPGKQICNRVDRGNMPTLTQATSRLSEH